MAAFFSSLLSAPEISKIEMQERKREKGLFSLFLDLIIAGWVSRHQHKSPRFAAEFVSCRKKDIFGSCGGGYFFRELLFAKLDSVDGEKKSIF